MGRKTVASPADMTDAWAKGMSGAGEKYKRGIARYQGNPMAEAAKPESQALYAQRTAEAAQGRMAAALLAVPVDRWRSQAMTFGATNLASASQKGKAKYAAKASKLQALAQSASDAANALPKSDSEGRMLAAMRAMKAGKGTITG